MSIKVLVADDHAIVRRGIVQILSEDEGIHVVGEAEDGPSVLRLAREAAVDVVVLDLNMPGASGLTILSQLLAEHPDIAVLVLSIHSEAQYGPRVIQSGAAGYIAKNAAPELLVIAVRHVAGGRRYITPAVAEALFERAVDIQEDPHDALSDREFEVFRSLASGSKVSEIAEALSLSVKTISTYRSRVLEKLGMRTNADLARYAVEKRLLDAS